MSLGESLFTVLSTDVALQALVSTRVYPSRLPDAVTQPAVVYTIVSDLPESTLAGAVDDTANVARVQLDAYARTYKQAHQVADAVKAALGALSNPTPGLSCWPESGRDLFDNETQLHRVSRDFTVWR